mmetsp:Transcript_19735/g.25594  ORF Transcript_19735/g.25594 Transcript_19735/m.25594 type:complete len:569 (+) Transcript_19735:264-1970(+)
MSESTVLEFLNQCPTLTATNPPESFDDLTDGVVLFEALAEISLDHFDVTTIARDIGSNWALKQTNLRKVVRNLEEYFLSVLNKRLDLSDKVDIGLIARHENSERVQAHDQIVTLFSFIAAAAVQCEDNSVFVSRIMNMAQDKQMVMKELIENALGGLEEEGGGVDDQNSESDSDDDEELDFNGSQSMLVNLLEEKLNLANAEIEKLQEKNNSEELLAANEKLRLFAEDLQERLQESELELTENEKELAKSKRSVEELSSKVASLLESNKLLEDEMSVANSQVAQLRKAEASVLTYRKKLEDAALTTQQMQELEDQSATYLRQIVDLENSVKTIPALKKTVAEYSLKLQQYEKQQEDSAGNDEAKDAELINIRNQLKAVVSSKKILEEELARVQHEAEEAERERNETTKSSSVNGVGVTFNSIGVTSEELSNMKEKVIRLEVENKALKDQINEKAGETGPDSAEVVALKSTIAALEADVSEREAMVNKLTSDKEKLEAYTKKTLHKFQEKYLVALQECKAKLKDKHDKIEALESRQAAERSAQKREERLLSGVMYELGLAIMQNRLSTN